MSDLINRAEAIEAVAQQWLFEASVGNPYVNDDDIGEYRKLAEELFEDVPSADAVSREECDECKTDKEGVLLQQLAELQGDYETMKNAYEDALADAEWIPCSERLPSDDEYVIVSVLDDHGDTPWKYTTVAWLCNEVWISDNDILCGTAVAWMPLPKPYKGGDDE